MKFLGVSANRFGQIFGLCNRFTIGGSFHWREVSALATLGAGVGLDTRRSLHHLLYKV